MAMIDEESTPAFAWITGPFDASQISGYGALGHFEAELQQATTASGFTIIQTSDHRGRNQLIFGAPQPEFSAAMVRMRVRISSLILGRPQDRDRQRQ
jgi:hypothetical protein